MSTGLTCPACDRELEFVISSKARIDRESELRQAFVRHRLGHKPADLEAMDLTRFMHGGPAKLMACRACGMLFRDEQRSAQYEDDVYDPVLMSHLYPRYLQAFEDKRSEYRPLLRDGAEVLEVGSHLGAFLQTAEQWGWRPFGLDIGQYTSAFARRQGGSVKRITLDDYSPHLRRPEAIFIWNCFEQLDDPSAALRKSHYLLNRHGLLVVRVPNAEFYREQSRQLEDGRSNQALRLLGYNNLLGFPYLRGYTTDSLDRLLRSHGFETVAVRNSSVLTPPYPDLSPRVEKEWLTTRRVGEMRAGLPGPWIEVISRRTENGGIRKPSGTAEESAKLASSGAECASRPGAH